MDQQINTHYHGRDLFSLTAEAVPQRTLPSLKQLLHDFTAG
jgi:hypothetical protein